MTDINKLRELAVRALPFAPGEWFVENGIDQCAIARTISFVRRAR